MSEVAAMRAFNRELASVIGLLQAIPDLQNLQMTKVTADKELQGKVKIEEWYEMTGSIAVPEGGKAFWVLSKPFTDQEPYHFFLRLDRNISASDYDNAIKLATVWVKEKFLQPIEAIFSVEKMSVSSPEEISEKSKDLRGSS